MRRLPGARRLPGTLESSQGAAVIDKQGTGFYIAYPTTTELKPIYRGLKTMVNNRHTKVGVTVKSFLSREREYLGTFGGEVEFVPIAEVPASQLELLEQIILDKVCEKYRKVGNAREWFDTDDRESIVAIVLSVLHEQQ